MIIGICIGVLATFTVSFGAYIVMAWKSGQFDPFRKEEDNVGCQRTVHELKCHPEPFLAVQAGDKVHEVRVFDRPFRVGDLLRLREFIPDDEVYSGQELNVLVTYITAPGTWGLPQNVGVLSIELVAA